MHFFIEYHVILSRYMSRLIAYFARVERETVVAVGHFSSVWLCHVLFCAVCGIVENGIMD
jgi:hypothetical protein